MITTYFGRDSKDGFFFSNLFTRRWLPTYLSRKRWPPLSTYLEGDGHLPTYFETAHPPIHLPTYLKRRLPPTYISRRRSPPTYLSRGTWPLNYLIRGRLLRLLAQLGVDGHPPACLGGDWHLHPYLFRKAWSTLPTYVGRDSHKSVSVQIVYLSFYLF